MGRVSFGCETGTDDKGNELFWPTISIEIEGREILLHANFYVETVDEARLVSTQLEKVLRSPRNNLTYSRNGDLN